MLSAGIIFFLAVLQGLTELFPVSSLGHAVVVPPLVGLNLGPTRYERCPHCRHWHWTKAFSRETSTS